MTARVFRLGDDIDTDQLAPGQYMSGGLETLAAHCLEAVCPGFASTVREGDIIVAGRNFGAGSSREQAAAALKHLGVSAVIAEGFAGIFYRNAINLGLPAILADDLAMVRDGARVRLDRDGARLLLEDGRSIPLRPIPENLSAILDAGGLVPYLKARFSGAAQGLA